MKKVITIVFIILLIIPIFTLSAQTVKWLIEPNFDSVSYYDKDVFRCIKDKKTQLIDFSGKNLLPSKADSVTEYTEGYALILNSKGADFQIKGYLEEDSHEFIPLSGNYYATHYSHFSDGLLVVSDEKGNQGYLDTRGRIHIPCIFKKARPFAQGWACVETKKEGTVFINKEGSYLIVQFHYGKLSIGTNFNEKGEALVGYFQDGQSDFAIINTSGKTISSYSKRNGKPYRDYDFAFNEGVPVINPKQNDSPSFDPNILVFLSEGHYGYKNMHNEIIVLPQFSYAGRFADNSAIVKLNNQYGVVAMMEGVFSSNIENTDIVVRSNKITELHYTLNIPEKIDSKLLHVRFDNGDGVMRLINMEQNVYSFIPHIDKDAKTCTIKAEVGSDDLLLWKDTIIKKINRIHIGTLDFSVPSKVTEYAGSDNNLNVRTFVINKSDTPTKVSVVYSTPLFQSGSKNSIVGNLSYQDVMLLPGEKKEFIITFKVNEKEIVKTSVTLKVDRQTIGTKSTSIELKPFDLIE